MKEERLNLEKVLVAGNRGPCGGVNMALEAARQVLDIVNGKELVYTNWDIVNNRPIVRELGERGLTSIYNNWDLVPDNAVVLFSAHGVPDYFHKLAEERNFAAIDATCQLVRRVHILAKKAEEDGFHIIYIGSKNHPETIGVLGSVKSENTTLIETIEDVKNLALPINKPGIVYSQTTLSTKEVIEILKSLKELYPDITIPPRRDICRAADNHQLGSDDLVKMVDLLLIVGSKGSHNSQELVKIGEKFGLPSFSVDLPEEIKQEWFDPSIRTVGVSSGASVLDRFTENVLDWFRKKDISIQYLPQVVEEKELTFKLPQKSIDLLKERYEKINS